MVLVQFWQVGQEVQIVERIQFSVNICVQPLEDNNEPVHDDKGRRASVVFFIKEIPPADHREAFEDIADIGLHLQGLQEDRKPQNRPISPDRSTV